jgi:hypothetical protein
MTAAIAKWRTRSGIRRTSSADTLSVDVEVYADPIDESGVARVDFTIIESTGATTLKSVTAPSLRIPNYSAQASPLPGVSSGMASIWAYGTTLDCGALAAGTVTVTATVYSGIGTATALPGSIKLYNDRDGTDRRPSTKQIYISPTGNDADPGTSDKPMLSLMRAVQACRANTSGSSSADRDCGGAEVVVMTGDNLWANGHTGVSDWHTSGDWWLTITMQSGARWIRVGAGTVFPDHYLTCTGAGSGSSCKIRIVGGTFFGRGGIVAPATNVKCDVWVDGAAQQSEFYDAGTKPYSVRFVEDDDQLIGFDNYIAEARVFASCVTKTGCSYGHAGVFDLHDFVIRSFLGVALQSTGVNDGASICNGLVEKQRYHSEVAGNVRCDVGTKVSVALTGGRMRIQQLTATTITHVSDGVTLNIGTQSAELIGSTYWGIKTTGFTNSANNGHFIVLATGTSGGLPWVELQNGSAVAEASAGASARIETTRFSNGDTYSDAIHPDIHQANADRTGLLFSHVAARDVLNAQGWFSGGHDLTRCVMVNCSDGGGQLVNNFTSSSFTDCLFLSCTFSGSFDFSASGETYTRNRFIDCVMNTASSLPSSGSNTVQVCHFITSGSTGTSPSTGAWFAASTTSTPWELTPSGGNLNTGSGLVPAPASWWHTGASADSRGVWRNVARFDWSVGTVTATGSGTITLTGTAAGTISEEPPFGEGPIRSLEAGAPSTSPAPVLEIERRRSDELLSRAIIARSRRFVPPSGLPAPGVTTEKHVLQKDFLNIVGSPTGGFVEVEFTRNADGGLRAYGGGGGGGGGGAWIFDEGSSSTVYSLGAIILDGGDSTP